MISVSEARRIIQGTVATGGLTVVAQTQALGRVLAQDVVAPFESPSFDSSAMDGYAIQHTSVMRAVRDAPVCLDVIGSVFAGEASTLSVRDGTAIRIMTGAMIPEGATAVVMQEDVIREGSTILCGRAVALGENIRRRGEEFVEGEVILTAGTRITPPTLGLLASLGMTTVPVFERPRVALIPTGEELVTGLQDKTAGKIMDTNSVCLYAALSLLGIEPTVFPPVGDDPVAVAAILREALLQHDVLIVTGGVSVGDKDFVRPAIRACGGREVFWGIAQKPGKPFLFAVFGQKPCFGLPGNPASALVCFAEYVDPALRRIMGDKAPGPSVSVARLTQPYAKKKGMTHFVRGVRDSCGVTPWSHQQSHRLREFAQSDCLVVIPQDVERIEAGGEVEIHGLWG